ncbi:MAG: hypothetical protein WCS30_00610 [Selenomonadaceae bacterium]
MRSSVNGLGSTDASAWKDLTERSSTTGGKKTAASTESDLAAQLKNAVDGTGSSGGSSSSSASGSKTSIEQSRSVGADGSVIVTLTQVTTAADGTTTSKVLSRTKMGGTTGAKSNSNLSSSSRSSLSSNDSGVSFMDAKAQVIMAKNGLTNSYAGNEYEQSGISSYRSGSTLKVES